MRVLTVGNLYPPHHLGGYELLWAGSVTHLRSHGHDVRILTTDHREGRPDPAIADDPEAFRELRMYWVDHGFPQLRWRDIVARERHNAATLLRHLDAFQPDAVCWWGMGGMSLSLLEQVRRAGVGALAVIADEWLGYGPRVDPWIRTWRRRGLARLTRPAERVVGVPATFDPDRAVAYVFLSEWLRSRTHRHGYRPAESVVAHSGVDTDFFRPDAPHPWRWRLLYVGRIDERKGIDLAIRSLEYLPPEATLTVVGPGDRDHLGALRSLAADRVGFRRVPRSELPRIYAEADALLFPVRWEEPWGLVPLEAMASGTPVVATGRGGSGEYLRAGENCLLFDPDAGSEPLAAAIRELASDEQLRRRLRQHGLETVHRIGPTQFEDAIAAMLERVAHLR